MPKYVIILPEDIGKSGDGGLSSLRSLALAPAIPLH